jgi:tungstate transport system substrate-binding protein
MFIYTQRYPLKIVEEMNSMQKIVAILLIIIILAGIGAYAAYSYTQKNQQNNQPTPTPTPTPTINATVTNSNQKVSIELAGNITQTQISNVTITPSQSAETTIIEFNITGSSGSGFSNMTIQKTSVAYGNTPTVYIDNQQISDQGYTQDTQNFYVWYTTHFSTHHVIILFTQTQSSATPTPTPTKSPTQTANPTATLSPTLFPTPTPSPTTLNVATTTSLHDTGLEDTGINGNTTGTIKAAFQAKYPWITVNFIALGTGAAIARAQAGDADMILVHSPSQELTFLTGGYGVDRKIIAYNFFTIVGPANDPAGIKGKTNVTDALITLYTAAQTNPQIQWVARNDSSGTATAEQNLWKAAGYTNYNSLLAQTSWFHATGQGMGASLLVANNGIGGGSPAYILSDMGTYLAYSKDGNIPLLNIEIQNQQALLNVYSAVIDNPQKAGLTNINFNAALTFVNYLVSSEGQQLIANFGTSTFGQQLFVPFVPLASGTAPNATLLGWIQSYAYINSTNQISASGTECPAAFRYNADTLYSPSYDTVAALNINAQFSAPNYLQTNPKQFVIASPSSTYAKTGSS